MSFTSLSIIKKHLLLAGFSSRSVRAYPITLPEKDEIELPDHSLVEGSDAVKWIADPAPGESGPFQFIGYDWVALPIGNLVDGSVVIALNNGLFTTFLNEVDFQVDHSHGLVRRIEGTAIPEQTTVYAFYHRYTLFLRDDDYVIDYVLGRIYRTATGAIPPDATVFIDYDVETGSVTDDLILQAIIEAEDRILRALASGYNAESNDQGLKTGATELTLSIMARDLAAEALSRRMSSDISGRAREWRELARLYEERAWQTLAPFLDPIILRTPGVHSND